MYDVVYLDQSRRSQVLAQSVTTESAVSIARKEARRLRAGRMFGTGSELEPLGKVVLIVESVSQAQAA
jgi:hypothetical protein